MIAVGVGRTPPQLLQHALAIEENSSVILLTKAEVHISEQSSSLVSLALHETVAVTGSHTHRLQSCLNQVESSGWIMPSSEQPARHHTSDIYRLLKLLICLVYSVMSTDGVKSQPDRST